MELVLGFEKSWVTKENLAINQARFLAWTDAFTHAPIDLPGFSKFARLVNQQMSDLGLEAVELLTKHVLCQHTLIPCSLVNTPLAHHPWMYIHL